MKGKSVPVPDKLSIHHEDVWRRGEWRYNSTILDLGTRWR
jgi:hypothetical protein